MFLSFVSITLPRTLSLSVATISILFLVNLIEFAEGLLLYFLFGIMLLLIGAIVYQSRMTKSAYSLHLIPIVLLLVLLVQFIFVSGQEISLLAVLILSIVFVIPTAISYVSWIRPQLGGSLYMFLAGVYALVSYDKLPIGTISVVFSVLALVGILFRNGRSVSVFIEEIMFNKIKNNEKEKHD